MKRSLLLLAIATLLTPLASGQSIVGKWQLVKETSCLSSEMEDENDTLQPLVDQMHSMSGATAQVVTFKEKNVGEENTRILNKRKSTNNKNFYYKFDGEMLMILDKRSQTIIESYIVDKFEADSLIVSSASRPCETRIFLKIANGR